MPVKGGKKEPKTGTEGTNCSMGHEEVVVMEVVVGDTLFFESWSVGSSTMFREAGREALLRLKCRSFPSEGTKENDQWIKLTRLASANNILMVDDIGLSLCG